MFFRWFFGGSNEVGYQYGNKFIIKMILSSGTRVIPELFKSFYLFFDGLTEVGFLDWVHQTVIVAGLLDLLGGIDELFAKDFFFVLVELIFYLSHLFCQLILVGKLMNKRQKRVPLDLIETSPYISLEQTILDFPDGFGCQHLTVFFNSIHCNTFEWFFRPLLNHFIKLLAKVEYLGIVQFLSGSKFEHLIDSKESPHLLEVGEQVGHFDCSLHPYFLFVDGRLEEGDEGDIGIVGLDGELGEVVSIEGELFQVNIGWWFAAGVVSGRTAGKGSFHVHI